MTETNPYKIIPVEGGYTWPVNQTNRKIRQVNELARNGDIKEVELNWVGQDGPFSLEDLPDVGSLDKVSHVLFGKEKKEVLNLAQKAWEPYIAKNGDDNQRIIISGATDKIGARNGELYYLKEIGNVIGINAAIEARELALANPGDIAFGNSEAWKDVAKNRPDLEVHEIGKSFLNYNSHRWLYKALECVGEKEPSDRELQLLINHLVQDPDKVVQVYMTDDETNMFLLYLRDKVNLVRQESGMKPVNKLLVDANSAEITKKLANKGYLYPSPESALNLRVKNDDYISWIEAEGTLSPIQLESGIKTPRMPGYHVLWEKDYERFKDRANLALDLMESRWGSQVNFFKHVEGSDGAGAFRVSEKDNRESTIKKLYNEGHSWVIEPFITYKKMRIHGKGVDQMRSVAPSIHVRGGTGYDTKLVQVMVTKKDENGNLKETTEWGGHVYAPKEYTKSEFKKGNKVLGMTKVEYETGLSELKQMAEHYGPQGFSRGGIDMGLGTIDTKWGKIDVNALQDMNIRTNGGDTARGFGKMLEREYGKEVPFATMVIKPNLGYGHDGVQAELVKTAESLGVNKESVKLITAVAPGWGMMGIVGDTPEGAFVDAIRVEEDLRRRQIIK